MGQNHSMLIDFHTRCELGVTLQTADATAKEPSQWQLEKREPMKLTRSNQGGKEAKEVNQRQLGDEPWESTRGSWVEPVNLISSRLGSEASEANPWQVGRAAIERIHSRSGSEASEANQ